MDKKLIDLLGSFPKKPNSLDMCVLEEKKFIKYTRQLISYKVEKNEKVTAYLFRPNSSFLAINGKYPAVLAIHQHADQLTIGKSELAIDGIGESNMSYGREIAERGYVVIVPDLLPFEERRSGPMAITNDPLQNELHEKLIYFNYLLNGSTLQAKYLSDLSCATDLLCSLDFVDANKIGAIGHSLGGQETIWIMMYDGRIKAGISSCGISTYKEILGGKIQHNFAFYIPNLMLVGDIDDFIIEIAPRSLFIAAGVKDDIFPIKGVYKINSALLGRYQNMKSCARYQFLTFEEGHSFPKNIRDIAYSWLDEQLVAVPQQSG